MSVYQGNKIEKEIDCNPEINEINTKLSEIKIENATNQPPSSSCPFNYLHDTIEWEILRNLNYKGTLNLALTCRKWYKTISTAPKSVKPTAQCDKLIAGEFGLIVKGKRHKWAKYYPNSCLFAKLECFSLVIGLNARVDLLKLLIANRSKLHVNRLYMKFPVKCEKQASLMIQLADISPNIFFENSDYQSRFENILPINRIVENITSHEMIENDNCSDASMTNIIIKQWIEGKRPNLQGVSCRISNTANIVNVDLDMLISEFAEYVQERKWKLVGNGRNEQHATIVVDGLPKMGVSCCQGYVFLRRMGCSRPFFHSDS